jgi:polysaccharide pyruvyl transferase WcaK-like protein
MKMKNRFRQIITLLLKSYRLFIQIIKQKQYKIAIIGCHHDANLGDIALGKATKNIAEKQGYKSVMQPINALDKLPYPKIEHAILGGGAIGYNDSLMKVAQRYENNLSNVAVLGVDFNEKKYSDKNILFIKNVAWISCRSYTQKERLSQVTGRPDIIAHPDIVFSLYAEFCKNIRNIKKKKMLLINLVPLYSSIIKGIMTPNERYRNERPKLYNSYHQMIDNYIKGVRSIVEQANKDGYIIETIPFTPKDEEFSKLALKDLPVKHNKYHSSPIRMIKKMALAEKIFVTRYHALIFGAKVGAQLIPCAYATKNEYLLEELNIPRSCYLSTDDLANGKHIFPEAITIPFDIVSEWEDRSMKHVVECVNRLMKKTK